MRIEELLFSDQPFMIFDEGFHPFGKIIFRNPIKTIEVYHLDTLLTSLNEINVYIKQGYYVAGFISYEAGYFFSDMNWKKIDTVLPLLYFAVFQNPEKFPEIETGPSQNYGFYISSIPNRKTYFENLDMIRTKLYQGEIYQINYTDKIFLILKEIYYLFIKHCPKDNPFPTDLGLEPTIGIYFLFHRNFFLKKKKKL